jgi:hypothetical protein
MFVIFNRESSTTPSNTGNSSRAANMQQQQQLRLLNYQIQLDRLFLAACQGIAEADTTHLDMYVNAGGNLTRLLTVEECALLGKPHVFSPGLTLLHLCYRFKRKDVLVSLLNKPAVQSKLIGSLNQNSGGNNSSASSTVKVLNALLKQVNQGSRTTKFSPCQSSPQMAAGIVERYFSINLRQRRAPPPSLQSSNPTMQQQHDLRHQTLLAGNNNSTNSPTSSLISLSNYNNNNHSPSPSPPPSIMLSANSSCCSGLSSANPSGGSSSISICSGGAMSSNTGNSGSSSSGCCIGLSSGSTGVCYYVNESHTFTLPNEIEDLAPKVQITLFDELLDREVQQELEYEGGIINWNVDLCKRLHGRLYPLWNRHNGDCLLDSVLQACYGVFDTDNVLRRVMAESLEQFASALKPRWKEHECMMARALDYRLDDYQLEQDWTNMVALANQPGASLEQAHIFALCHIFRRPIVVYSVKYVKSFRGENIGFTHFEGVYLPLAWEPQFCFKSPIALGYTRGHFTALVPLDRTESFTYFSGGSGGTSSGCGGGGSSSNSVNSNVSGGGPTVGVANPNAVNASSTTNSASGACGGGVGLMSSNSMRSNSNTSLGGGDFGCSSGAGASVASTSSSTGCSNNNLGNTNNSGNNSNPNGNANNSSANILGAVSNTDYYSSSNSEHSAASNNGGSSGGNNQQLFYLPLTNKEGQLLPVHFLTGSEVILN